MLFFFAWGLATAVVAFLFPLSTLWPKTDLKGPPLALIRVLIFFQISLFWIFSRWRQSFWCRNCLTTSRKRWTNSFLPYDLGPLSSSLSPKKQVTHPHSEEEPLRFECYGGRPPFLIWNPLLFSAFSFLLRREALSLTKTSSSEKNRSPRLSLHLLSLFLTISLANELISLSGFWPTQLWQEV